MDIEKIKAIAKEAHYTKLLSYLEKNSKIQDPKPLRELIALAGYQDFRFFVRHFFDAHCRSPFSQMHEDFFQDQQGEKRGRREVIAAPRGHAKTTFKVHFEVCHALIYGYEHYILIVCQSAIEAKERVTKIFEELQTNQKIRDVFGLLVPERGKAGLKRSFIAENGIKVEGLSIGQQIRGKSHQQYRPSRIILDDVETLESAYSPLQRAKLKDWFNKDLLKCAQTDGSSNITVIGTCIHTESLLSDLLLRTSGWAARKYQAVIQFSPNEFLWKEWRRIYTDLGNSQREVEAEQFFQTNQVEMLQDTRVLWPEVESYLDLMKQIVTAGEAAFQSEKQNEPYDPERQIFDMDQARYFQLDWAKQEIVWLDGSGRIVPLSNLKRIIAFHDLALGANPNQASTDYAAIVVVGEDQDGYHYVLDCYLEKSLPDVQIEQGFRLHEQWSLYGLYIEENGAQRLLLFMYEDQRERFPQAKNLIIRGIQQTGDKIRRISTLQPDIANGQLLFQEDLNPRFFSQLRLFPTTLHDDGPDALQGAVFQLKELSRKQIITSGIQTSGYSRRQARYTPTNRNKR